MSVALRRATEADIPFIHATERLPGYEPLVGRFEADAHRANLADPSWQYFIRAGNDRARHVYESLGFVAEGPEGPDDPVSTIMAVTRAQKFIFAQFRFVACAAA